MRSATLCVFFALIIHSGSRASDSDFRPIPIPLDAWGYERREGRVGTLHEAIKTDAPPAVAAVPAHYWEDALRHSVYLTLVRDKIDQLIARGVIVSPSSKPEEYVSKEIDDHDLWDKIKKAPFDRLVEDELLSLGDVTVMAKGRLMEDNAGYRFTEDERSKEDCSDDKCMEGVKAFWSVKRVRQRDVETSPGKYHYELTFSVNSQPPTKYRKPHENPVRTFTVRENAPDTVVGTPKEHPFYQPARPQQARPQRAVWIHKNIGPKQNHQGRYYHQGLDRIFSSFFSDDEPHAEPPPRYKPNPYAPPPPMYSSYSKLGSVGLSSDQHQQKRLMPYPYKPHQMYKYRPPLTAPPLSHVQQHFIDVDVVKHPYIQQSSDHKYTLPSNIVKTTRPAVLPTPPMTSLDTTPNASLETYSNKTILEETTKIPEMPTIYPTVYKTYTKQRPVKINYFSEHIRPPIYNAPPGVFVTMDKKPFKPMPPLKHSHHMSRPPKKPIDFRPSPQLIDGQFSDLDTNVDSAFRPILRNHTDDDSTDDIEVNSKEKHLRKQTSKKPPKKHENIKWHATTSGDDIITVNNDSKEDDMQWADVLGAFSKTTPMHSQGDKKTESTTQIAHTTTKKKPMTTSTEAYEVPTTTTTTTTPAPKKRTRPPHKFVKPEKVKKHKRITTTSTKAPELPTLRKPSDLTPQASSAATNAPKTWEFKNKTATAATTTQQTTITTTTTTTTTTQTPATKSSPHLDTTTKPEITLKPTQPKNRNRFRLTTLMQKGTSVKHDRWSVNNNNSSDKKTSASPAGNHPPRRKGSNFQGYAIPSTSKYSTREEPESERLKHSQERDSIRSSTESITIIDTNVMPMQSSFEEIPVHFNVESTSSYTDNHSEETDEDSDEDFHQNADVQIANNDEQESADQTEFIFGLNSSTPSERTNEIIEEEPIVTEQTIVASTLGTPKNKTKCKKKKHMNLVPTTTISIQEDPTTPQPSPSSTKASATGIDFLDEILGSLTYDETTEKTTKETKLELEEDESENHEKYLKIDEDFEEFLGNLGGKHGHSDDKDSDVDYEDEDPEAPADDDDEDDVSPFDNEDVDDNSREHPRDSNDPEYEDYRERSYSLLELMAME